MPGYSWLPSRPTADQDPVPRESELKRLVDYAANAARRTFIQVEAITTSSGSMLSPTHNRPSSPKRISTRMSEPRSSA
jgi:hypothetical protein